MAKERNEALDKVAKEMERVALEPLRGDLTEDVRETLQALIDVLKSPTMKNPAAIVLAVVGADGTVAQRMVGIPFNLLRAVDLCERSIEAKTTKEQFIFMKAAAYTVNRKAMEMELREQTGGVH